MNYPIKLEIPVAWGEMDALGHVNNVVFFRYFESVRIQYFRAIDDAKLGEGLMSPILANTECNYLRPVYFPDTLQGEAGVSRVGNSSFTMEYRLHSSTQNAVVAEGKAVIVNVDPKTGKSAPIPEAIKDKIQALES